MSDFVPVDLYASGTEPGVELHNSPKNPQKAPTAQLITVPGMNATAPPSGSESPVKGEELKPLVQAPKKIPSMDLPQADASKSRLEWEKLYVAIRELVKHEEMSEMHKVNLARCLTWALHERYRDHPTELPVDPDTVNYIHMNGTDREPRQHTVIWDYHAATGKIRDLACIYKTVPDHKEMDGRALYAWAMKMADTIFASQESKKKDM